MRDLNKMYLRFPAQYQIAVALDNLERDQEAVETLFRFNQDLLERSDVISPLQYSFFLDQIRNLAPRLLASPELSASQSYQAELEALAEQSKKHIREKYFLQLLDRKLYEMVIARKEYKASSAMFPKKRMAIPSCSPTGRCPIPAVFTPPAFWDCRSIWSNSGKSCFRRFCAI